MEVEAGMRCKNTIIDSVVEIVGERNGMIEQKVIEKEDVARGTTVFSAKEALEYI